MIYINISFIESPFFYIWELINDIGGQLNIETLLNTIVKIHKMWFAIHLKLNTKETFFNINMPILIYLK